MNRKSRSSTNYGIQADIVKGFAVAVGENSHAESNNVRVDGNKEIINDIESFITACKTVEIAFPTRVLLDKHLNAVKEEINSGRPNKTSIEKNLKETGSIVQNIAQIVDGGTKLVAPFNLLISSVSTTLSMLGLN